MNIPFIPERIFVNSTMEVLRAKVPGGWLVTLFVNGRNFDVTTTFVADAEWSWVVEN